MLNVYLDERLGHSLSMAATDDGVTLDLTDVGGGILPEGLTVLPDAGDFVVQLTAVQLGYYTVSLVLLYLLS